MGQVPGAGEPHVAFWEQSAKRSGSCCTCPRTVVLTRRVPSRSNVAIRMHAVLEAEPKHR